VLLNSLSSTQLRSADFALRMDVHHTLMQCGTPGVIEAGRREVRRAWPELVAAIGKRVREKR